MCVYVQPGEGQDPWPAGMEVNMRNGKLICRAYGRKKEGGFALLEYCAGAAVILVVLWAAVNTMGDNISTLLSSIGNWATQRAGEIDSSGSAGN